MQPRKIELTNGGFALVDDEDFEMLSKFSWRGHNNGRMTYASAYLGGGRKNGRKGYMHRLIMNAQKGQMIDHKNRDGLDNRRENLRFTDRKGNEGNSRPRLDSRSKYKGVFFSQENQKWVAQGKRNGKTKHLGTYKTEELAALAFDKSARDYYKDFAFLNFPDITDYSVLYVPKRYSARGTGDFRKRYYMKNREAICAKARERRKEKK